MRRPLLQIALEFVAGDQPTHCDPLDDDELAWGIESGFGPILDKLFDSSSTIISPAQRARLHAAKLESMVRTDINLNVFYELLDACTVRSIPVTLLKGISTCIELYGAPYLRVMRDIDVLVDPQHTEPLTLWLLDSGYVQLSKNPASYYIEHHHLMPFYNSAADTWVEIHTALLPARHEYSKSPQFSKKAVKEETVCLEWRGCRVGVLSRELQLLYTAAHWAEDFTAVGGLVPIADILLLITDRAKPVRPEKLVRWCRDPRNRLPIIVILEFIRRNGLAHDQVMAGSDIYSVPAVSERFRAYWAHWIIDCFMVRGQGPVGFVLTPDRLDTFWRALLYPSPLFESFKKLFTRFR